MVPEGDNADAMQQLWWEGVRKWYNDEDYEGAMNAWTLALFHFARSVGSSPRPENRDDGYHRWLNEDVDEEEDLRNLSISMNSIDGVDGVLPRSDQEPFMSPLFLFLAGCWLDAGRYSLARKCLRVCLRECWLRLISRRGSDEVVCDTIRRALVEYAASFEEENPARSVLGRQIVEVAQANFPSRASSYRAIPWSDPYQRPGYLHPNLPAQPFYDGSDRPAWCDALEGQYLVIRNEFVHLYFASRSWPRVGQGDHRGGSGIHDGRVVLSGDWRETVLFGSGAVEDNVAPLTRKWIRVHVPEAVDLAEAGGGEVIFSVLQPGTTLLPHCATTNLRLTAHLGLVIPNDSVLGRCRIRVGSRWETWHEGKVLVFDDSFEHEVENSTDEMRAVLLIRFWHPQLPEKLTALQSAVRAKRMDERRRYNPPLPGLDDGCPVRRRVLELSQCRACWSSGYKSVRVFDSRAEPASVQCVCGRQIVD